MACGAWGFHRIQSQPQQHEQGVHFQKRVKIDVAGFREIVSVVEPWPHNASLADVAQVWKGTARREIAQIDLQLSNPHLSDRDRINLQLRKSNFLHSEGKPEEAGAVLAEAREFAMQKQELAREWLYTVIHLQGVAALRQGENENCILCRGESSCIFPISHSAIHQNEAGSRQAIEFFTEYLQQFPDDLGSKWLLNLAHMTLGEYPQGIDSRYLLPIEPFLNSEFDIGRFHDIGDLVGVNRFNHAGGAIMDDFDNDGLLDLVITSIDVNSPMAIYRNDGRGKFQECAEQAGMLDQLGGLYCVQTDFNNDGFVDVYVPRGAWIQIPIRPTLLQNNGDGTFTDVTHAARLLDPMNSNSAVWADYDNDGNVDLFVCCEAQPNRLYRNRGDGRFVETAAAAGLSFSNYRMCKGATWLDYNNDGYMDLFQSFLNAPSNLFLNNQKGEFTDASLPMQIDGPAIGFSCWAWDFDNDGWTDIFATSYDHNLVDVVKGLIGMPHQGDTNRLYRNIEGKRFENVAHEAGLEAGFATMGSNFADFDNDGFLDMYLGTGDPSIDTLIPNRLLRNVGGQRFADITASSRTGHLQKGHGVACGDWNRDGNNDIYFSAGGVINGDRYHNILFQNPGNDHGWLTLKLIGVHENRSSLGARITIVTKGKRPLTIRRTINTGSSFGANPFEQTIGLGEADRIERLEIRWPSSGKTQVFRDLDVNQSLQAIEGKPELRRLPTEAIPAPQRPQASRVWKPSEVFDHSSPASRRQCAAAPESPISSNS